MSGRDCESLLNVVSCEAPTRVRSDQHALLSLIAEGHDPRIPVDLNHVGSLTAGTLLIRVLQNRQDVSSIDGNDDTFKRDPTLTLEDRSRW